jgi:CBS domain-containing protein
MHINHLIKRDIETLPPKSTCADAARLMKEREIGCVVVAVDDEPVGIITDRDIVTRVVAAGDIPDKVTIGDVMSDKPILLGDDRSVDRAIETMNENTIRRLIVVDDEGLLEGVVTLDDILEFVSRQISRIVGSTRVGRLY